MKEEKNVPCSSYISARYLGALKHGIIISNRVSTVKVGAFTLLTLRFLKSRHFDPTIYTCANNREVSVSRNFTIFGLVVRMCDHRLQCMHSCMQSMQYA